MRRQRRARPGEINHGFWDRFTFVHALVGVGLGTVGLPILPAVLVAAGWEVVERPLKDHVPALFPHATQDTWRNIVGDVAGMLAGWWLGLALTRRGRAHARQALAHTSAAAAAMTNLDALVPEAPAPIEPEWIG